LYGHLKLVIYVYTYVICGAYLCCCDDHSSHWMLLVSCMDTYMLISYIYVCCS